MLPEDPQPVNPLVTIPMDDDTLKKWKGDLERADTRRKVFEPSWERNLKAYSPDPANSAWGDEINVGVDFYQTEQKKDQLFFDTPTVILVPEPDSDPNLAGQISAQQTKLNRKIGRTDLHMKRLVDKVLVDIICPAGMGCIKLGVTQITKDVPVPHPTMPGQPNLDPQGQPITAPVPVYQKIFAERFSPKKILIPTNFHDTEYDKAPWLGMTFTMAKRAAIRQYQLPPDFAGKTSNIDEQVFQQPGVKNDADANQDEVTGKVVYYHADLYDDNVYHPDWFRELVFIDGIDDPVVHRDCPYQTFQDGAFTPDSLLINPIRVWTVRDLPDSAYPPSDSTILRPLVNELNRFRTQLVEMRDASTSIRLADEKVITPEVIQNIVHGPFGSILRIANLDVTHPPIIEVAHPTHSRENFQSQEIIERDISKITTLGANQAGAETDTTHSATEMTYVQRNSDVRLQAERNRIEDQFLKLVGGIDALMKRYETPTGQQPLTGYSYDIKPDSGIHIDGAADRKFSIDVYNMLAKDPNVNRSYLLTVLGPKMHLDPTKLIVQPPPPHAEPPKTSLIVKGDDLNPLNPQYPNMLEILNEIGVKVTDQPITPDMITNAAMAKPLKPSKPAPHGGAPEQADKVNQHTADLSGKTPNFGGQAGAH